MKKTLCASGACASIKAADSKRRHVYSTVLCRSFVSGWISLALPHSQVAELVRILGYHALAQHFVAALQQVVLAN